MKINLIMRKLVLVSGVAALLACSPVYAQKMQENGETGARQAIKVPARWLTKDEVEGLFGAPLNKSQAVGNPPISWWEYNDCYVYFEGDRVLDAFAKK